MEVPREGQWCRPGVQEPRTDLLSPMSPCSPPAPYLCCSPKTCFQKLLFFICILINSGRAQSTMFPCRPLVLLAMVLKCSLCPKARASPSQGQLNPEEVSMVNMSLSKQPSYPISGSGCCSTFCACFLNTPAPVRAVVSTKAISSPHRYTAC